MRTTIVVIGSVTPKQYQDIRLKQLKLGNKPSIKRIDSANFLSGQYVPSSWGMADYLDKTFNEVIDDPLNTCALIIDHNTWNQWDPDARNEFLERASIYSDYSIDVSYVNSAGEVTRAEW